MTEKEYRHRYTIVPFKAAILKHYDTHAIMMPWLDCLTVLSWNRDPTRTTQAWCRGVPSLTLVVWKFIRGLITFFLIWSFIFAGGLVSFVYLPCTSLYSLALWYHPDMASWLSLVPAATCPPLWTDFLSELLEWNFPISMSNVRACLTSENQ